MPRIAIDGEPMKFIGLTSEERQIYEKQRREWNERRDQHIQASADNVPVGDDIFKCIVGSLVIGSPLCLFIVPMVHGDKKGRARAAAAREFRYMPALPSDEDFAAIYERIREPITASKVAERVLTNVERAEQPADQAEFPRLLVRADSAKATSDSMVVVNVVVQAQPAVGVTWPATEHRYHFAYGSRLKSLESELHDAETSIAASIMSSYRLWLFSPDCLPGGARRLGLAYDKGCDP